MEEEPRDNDQRREEVLASTPLFEPNLKSSKATQAQLDKFKELQKRYLQIKQMSEDNEKLKGKARRCGKVNKEDIVSKATEGTCGTDSKEDSTFYTEEKEDEALSAFASKKRRKLHWGLDVKERWERKANM